jgi:hypothetical protein
VRLAEFPCDRTEAHQPGLYAWWANDEARSLLTRLLGGPVPSLLYVGQAGATMQPSGRESAATLFSRIRGQHAGGNAISSTFRRTLCAVLHDELRLEVDGTKGLTADSNFRISRWMDEHLRVSIAPFPDRHVLGIFEQAVVRFMDPSLNLKHVESTPIRRRAKELRRRFRTK